MEEAGLSSEGGSSPGVDVMLVVGQMALAWAIWTENPERRHNSVALCVMLSVETDEMPLSSPCTRWLSHDVGRLKWSYCYI